MIPYPVLHLQVLIGDPVVRLADARCHLNGKVFTLPTYLEVFPDYTTVVAAIHLNVEYKDYNVSLLAG